MRLLLLVFLAACAADPAADAPPPSEARPAERPAERPVAAPDTADGAWTVGVVDVPASGDAQAQLTAVRAARHEGFDRLAFEFDGDRPAARVAYVDRPVRACGSGDVVELPGEGWLEVRFSGARAHTEAGEATVDGTPRAPGLPAVAEWVRTCDFEGEVTVVAAVASPLAVRVTTLDGPARVVVDVRHP